MKREKLRRIAITVLKLVLVGLCQVVGFFVPAVGLLSVGLVGGRKVLVGYTIFCLIISSSVFMSSLTGEAAVLAYVPFLEPIFTGAKALTLWQLVNFPVAWAVFLIVDSRLRQNKSSVVS